MTMSRRELIKGIGASAALTLTGAPARAQLPGGGRAKVIDIHGHYTTVPRALTEFRQRQLAEIGDGSPTLLRIILNFSDDQIRESVQQQLNFQRERGTDVTLFSPTAGVRQPASYGRGSATT